MNDITLSDVLRAKKYRDEGMSRKNIGSRLGRNADTMRCHLDPAFHKLYTSRINEYRRHARRNSKEEKAGSPGMIETIMPSSRYKHAPRLMAERDARKAVPLTLDNILTGTPRKGRSALDGWIQQGAPEGTGGGPQRRPEPWHPLRQGEAREAAE